MTTNRLRQILQNHGTSIATRISSRWGLITELAGYGQCYDYIEYLAEYAPLQTEDYENLARACELHNMGSILKVDFQNRFWTAQKALAAGMQGILFTDCKTPAEVEECVRMTMPDTPEYGGRFGYPSYRWIGYHPNKPQLDYAKMAAESVRLFMIEKKEAVDHIEEICRIPGVDMIQFGPSEFFALYVFSLVVIAVLQRDSRAKGILAAVLGLLIGAVGTDPVTGASRMTFGLSFLRGGFDSVPVLVGTFAISELMVQYAN